MTEPEKPYKQQSRELEHGSEFAAAVNELLRQGWPMRRIASSWGISEVTARAGLRREGLARRQQWVPEDGDRGSG